MKNSIKEKMSGWGGYPVENVNSIYPNDVEEILREIKKGNVIARGNGRSYGDSAQNIQKTINMRGFNKMLSFDNKFGVLEAEAGVLVEDIINTFLPKGWFPYVTPGSKFVSIGGLISADVHGKNHHNEGSFRNYVEWLDLINNEGSIVRCSREKNKDLFEWTIGGMGLTGIIVRAAIKLRPVTTGWIKQKTYTATKLDQILDVFEKTKESTYSVAWININNKKNNFFETLITTGEHATIENLDEKKKSFPLKLINKKYIKIPFYFPEWFLNDLFVKIFNSIYYFFSKNSSKEKLIHWNSYFYPLDNILNWNKIYGKKGFLQYQCVIPLSKSKDGLEELIREIKKSKISSFLSVLKRFGKQGGKFSFPMEGYTIALDFPNNKKVLELLDRLDKIVIKFEGRVYLAKDSRMKKNIFKEFESRAQDFIDFRNKNNLINKFKSSQSSRLEL